MQIYSGFPIATNIPTKDEMSIIPHHMFGFLEPTTTDYTATNFVADATRIIDEIHSRNKIPILVGGTHYYLYSLMWKNEQLKTFEKQLNEEIITELEQGDSLVLWEKLNKIDNKMAEKLHQNDKRKITKALEYYHSTGNLPSNRFMKEHNVTLNWDCCFLWVDSNIEFLGPKLDSRVDDMIDNGLLSELHSLLLTFLNERKNIQFTKGLFQSIGGKEFESYTKLLFPSLHSISENELVWDDNISNADILQHFNVMLNENQEQLIIEKEKGREALKLRTRQYARKQKPWIRNKILPRTDLFHIDVTDTNDWENQILKPALFICERFLDDKLDTLTSHNWFLRKQEIKSELKSENWQKFHCNECSKTYNGKHEWDIHLRSKKHKIAKKKFNKNKCT